MKIIKYTKTLKSYDGTIMGKHGKSRYYKVFENAFQQWGLCHRFQTPFRCPHAKLVMEALRTLVDSLKQDEPYLYQHFDRLLNEGEEAIKNRMI